MSMQRDKDWESNMGNKTIYLSNFLNIFLLMVVQQIISDPFEIQNTQYFPKKENIFKLGRLSWFLRSSGFF